MNNLKPYEINQNNVTPTWLNINSNSVASFNSIVTFDINQLGKINELYLLFNMGPIIGVIANAVLSQPAPISAFKWFTNVTYSYQGSVVDTVTNDQNFIHQQISFDDQDRVYLNTASGNYQSQAQRYLLGQNSNIYQVPLRSFINQIQPEILSSSAHSIRVAVTLDSLVNILDVGALVGATMNINSVSLLVKMQKLDIPTINYKMNQILRLGKYQDIFCSNLQQQFTALAGSTTAIINLPNFINSNINYVYFTIRPINSLVRAASFNYVNNIVSYHLINSSGESLCGGQPILSNIGLYVLNRDTTRGSYSTETGSSVFFWFHSTDPIRTLQTGTPLASRLYNGSENLTLVFNSALAINHQIDIYASAVSIFNQTSVSVSKL